MKQKVYVLIILILGVFTNSFAQKGRFSVRFAVKSLDCVTGKVVIRLDVKSSSPDSTFRMGDANYRFDYDSRVIKNPQIVSQENFASPAPSSDVRYNPQNLNGSTAGPTIGTVSLNTTYGGSGTGAALVPTEWTTVSCLQFDIINTQLITSNCFGLRWHTDTEFPVTGMNEYTTVPVSTTNPTGYQLTNVTSSKFFGNIQVCIPEYCSIDAIDDVNSTTVNTAVSGNVKTNDLTDPLVITTTPVINPKNGSIVLNADGTYTYTPNPGYTGKDSVRYRACKQFNPTLCDEAWLRITITGTTVIDKIKARDDLNSTLVNVPVDGNVASNDSIAPLVVNTTPVVGPKNGTIVLNANGLYTYTPNPGYVGKDSVRYRVCKQASPTTCDEAWLRITITGPALQTIDLSLAKTVSKLLPTLNEVITYSLVVTNSSSNTATGVAVKDTLPAGVVFQSATGQGTYNATTGLWTVGTIGPNGTATLVVTVRVNAEGTWFNKAQVSKADQPDLDSTPDNDKLSEDDLAIACFAVPVRFCEGDVYQLTLPSGYGGIQWFKDGQPITGATFATYNVTAIGNYTFTSTTTACPIQGCCPVIFVGGNCCKAVACVPLVISKTKTGARIGITK